MPVYSSTGAGFPATRCFPFIVRLTTANGIIEFEASQTTVTLLATMYRVDGETNLDID